MFSAIDSLHDLKKTGLGLLEPLHVGCGAHHSGTPTSPLASQSACLMAEEDLGVHEKAPLFMGARLGHER